MDRGSWFRVWIPGFLGIFALVVIFRSGPGPRDWVRWVGLLIAVMGFSGVMLARYTLGRSFSITPQARELVTTGIYSRIRNPIYVFGVILFVGFFLIFRNPHLWGLLVPLVVAQAIRARKEARVLEGKFGDQYREYRARTWF